MNYPAAATACAFRGFGAREPDRSAFLLDHAEQPQDQDQDQQTAKTDVHCISSRFMLPL
jgi:hypothetical protein